MEIPLFQETMVVSKSTMAGGSPTLSHQLELDESRPNSSAEAREAASLGQDANANPNPSPQPSNTSSEPPAIGTALPMASSTPSNSHDAHLDTDMSDTTESEPDKALGDPSEPIGECRSSHEGREMMRLVLPISVDNLFAALFTDSKFFNDFHNQRNTTNMRLAPWEKTPSKKDKQRTINFDIPINQALVGRKTSQVTESQAMRGKAGLIYEVDVDTSQIGFPYADSFSIFAHFCLKRIADNESSVTVHVDIKFKKPVWVMKSYIEKHTWAGLEEYYAALAKAITAECGAIVDGLNCRPLVKESTKARRRLRTAPRRLSTAQRLTEEAIVPNIVRPTAGGRRSLSRGSVGSPDRRFEAGVILSNPRVKRPTNSTKLLRTDTLYYMVLAVLMVLMLLNGVLYYKLWALEQWTLTDPFGPSIHNEIAALKQNPPKTHEDWIVLLRKQESLHSMEVHKWHKVLRSAVILLKKTEESLRELQANIQPRLNRQWTPSHNEL